MAKEGSMCGRESYVAEVACMAGGMHGRGHMWQEGVHAGEMATEVGGTHPTGMHSCLP